MQVPCSVVCASPTDVSTSVLTVFIFEGKPTVISAHKLSTVAQWVSAHIGNPVDK